MTTEERALLALYAIELELEPDVDRLVERGLDLDVLERIRRGHRLLEYQRELALEQLRPVIRPFGYLRGETHRWEWR